MANNNISDQQDIGKEEEEEDSFVNWMAKSLQSIKSGRVLIRVEDNPAVEIKKDLDTNRISIDILNPDMINPSVIFKSQENPEETEHKDQDHKGTFDKIKDSLKSVKEFANILTDEKIDLFGKLDDMRDFAQKLTENNMTVVLLRKGKEMIVLGKDAKPSVSRIVSGSDDMQLKSVKEVSKLAGDLAPEE